MSPFSLLSAADPPCHYVEQPDGQSPFVFTCDHAGNAIPSKLGSLGVSAHDLSRHIAWDIGSAGLGRYLARQLDAFLILQAYSRLVIDVNRPLHAPDSIVTRSERTDIPGNAALTLEQKQERARAVFEPYHARIQSELVRRERAGQPSVLVTLHSFTPVFMDVPRRWHVGVLTGRQRRLGDAVLERLRRDATLEVGDNEPYAVSDDGDYTLLVHGEQRGIPHVELEIRQDLLATESDQQSWAKRLAALLRDIASASFPT